MNHSRNGRRYLGGLLALALLGCGALSSWAAPLDADRALRDEVLKLNDVTGDAAATGRIRELAKDAPRAKKLLGIAYKMSKEKEQPLQINATLILARTAHLLKETEMAESFYRLNAQQAEKLRSGLKLGTALSGLSSLFFENKKYDECEKICRELLEKTGEDKEVWQAQSRALRLLIIAQARQGKAEEALKMVDNLIKAQEDNLSTRELKGRVQQESGQTSEAAKTYEDLLNRINNDKKLKDDERKEYANDVRYLLSGVYVDLNQVDKAAQQLQTLLADEPDNATYNNDLGYIWADHDMKLDESEKLIRKAIADDKKLRQKENPQIKPEDDKDNAAYLDSLGWVLFKKKKNEDAKKYLLQAVEDKDGQHLEIYDHLGDVYMALGDKAKAVETWKKGLEVTGESKREQQKKAEVEKKLKANQ